MSRFFPHTQFAEDQPLSHTILTAHVLYRGFQAGSTIGILTGATRSLLFARRRTAAPIGNVAPSILGILQRSTGIGALIGTGLMVVALPLRMWDQTEVQWQDRSWRLLKNAGQMEVDDWSLIGTVVGTAWVVAGDGLKKGEPRRWARVLGGAGMGSMAGVMGYMVWRYGIRGGKR